MSPLLFLNISGGEIFIIFAFVLVFFGSKKIPGFARSMGKVMRQVKNASDEVKRNIEDSANDIKETVMSERKNHTDKEEK
jgi:sec-independent protein translocase protein TatA|tara:strand:- start:18193 stop:18432 length:240 start_codon:yes stop_codon:yes gene_type:complete